MGLLGVYPVGVVHEKDRTSLASFTDYLSRRGFWYNPKVVYCVLYIMYTAIRWVGCDGKRASME